MLGRDRCHFVARELPHHLTHLKVLFAEIEAVVHE
jgi:hypothetical protein